MKTNTMKTNTIKTNTIMENIDSPKQKKYITSEKNIKKNKNGNYIDHNKHDEVEISKYIIKEYTSLLSLLTLINEKKIKLIQTKSLLELKYNKYKKCHNFWNIFTIFLSSSLTLIESSKLVFFNIHEENNININVQSFFILSPIFLGTFITCSASIIKFKKYQEQMEQLYIVIDKCIGMIAKLKTKKDEILLLKTKEKQLNIDYLNNSYELEENLINFKKNVESINDTFKNDILKEFSVVYHETEKYITYNDYNKYLSIINDIEYKKHILKEDKITFYNKYNHDIENNRINDLKNNVINEKKKIKNCCGFQY